MKPPYTITSDIFNIALNISEKLGAINAIHMERQDPELRKNNRIKTIQSSLEIEGNTLSLDQVTAIFNNKRVIGKKNEILEVKNAIATYDNLNILKAHSIPSFRNAHKILMNGLIANAGKFRTKSVGIVKGTKIAHVAPPGSLITGLMKDLFNYLKKDTDSVLIKSCVFHYEMEFIHPFMDGNGRMGRLWQSLILSEHYPIFSFLPIETIIKNKQQDYYDVLGYCDKKGESTEFIKFMLEIILTALDDVVNIPRTKSLTTADRLKMAKEHFDIESFQRKDYMLLFKEISAPTASRDLKYGVDKNLIRKKGKHRLTEYLFK